jgi:hypothetical protein
MADRMVLDGAALTGNELDVIRGRLAGRSFGEIAEELPKPGGGKYSRQRVQQVEAQALRKLGATPETIAAVHEQERIDRGLALWEKGQRVRLVEMTAGDDVPPRRRRLPSDRERSEQRLDNLASRLLREAADRGLSAVPRACYAREAGRLAACGL